MGKSLKCAARSVREPGSFDSLKLRIVVIELTLKCAPQVVCPPEAAEQPCPPRPNCYPDDWKLECVIDPCTCKTIWIDQDVRAQPDCAQQIVPECVQVQVEGLHVIHFGLNYLLELSISFC